MDSKKIRNSNIEILRVIAMFVIVVYHISVHCARFQLIDKETIDVMGNYFFCHPRFYNSLFLLEGVMPLGITANDIFLLISGYFLVEKGKDLNLGNISKKLLLQVGFAAMVLTLGSTTYCLIKYTDLTNSVNLRNIFDFNYMNWFVGYYFAVMVIAYVFLNRFLEKLDKKGYGILLITLMAIFSLGWSGSLVDGLTGGLRTLVCGVFLYALGGYIKRYNPFAAVRAWALIAVILVLYGLIYASYFNTVENNIHSYMIKTASIEAAGGTADIFIQPLFTIDNYSVVAVILAIVLFELFSRIKMRNSRMINGIAGGTFMIYLLHDNDLFRSALRRVNWIGLLADNVWLYIIKIMEYSAVVFVVGLIVYLLYVILGKVCVLCKSLVVRQIPSDK